LQRLGQPSLLVEVAVEIGRHTIGALSVDELKCFLGRAVGDVDDHARLAQHAGDDAGAWLRESRTHRSLQTPEAASTISDHGLDRGL
jgi:hypothetical protein